MHLDFWNNPLVVTSLRIRYRRGGLMNLMVTYFLLLVAGSALLYYHRERFRSPFPLNLFLGLLGIQFLISFMMASTATSQSLRNEVINRTFDFQRIASLSPFQILLGKLLGEAMLAFFSILPTIPLAVYSCLILGVEGMTVLDLLLVYATLLTTTLLSGATGLLQPLEADPNGKNKPANNLGAILFGSFFCAVPGLLAGGGTILKTPWSAALLGLFTPIPTCVGIYDGNPWEHGLSFFDRQIPFILLTPVSQLAITALILHAMIRRLVNPSRTLISRPVAYLALFVCDLIAAGVFYDKAAPIGLGLYARTSAFWLVHLLFAVLHVNLITPSRDALWSWSWRFRGRTSWLRDWFIGERSVNSLVLVVMACIGLADYFALLFLPSTNLFTTPGEIAQFMPGAIRISLACTILLLAAGSLFQWIVIAFDRVGRGYFYTLLVLLILPADLAGRYFQIDFLLALTPSWHFGQWLKGEPSQNLFPMVALYSGILLATQVWTHRRIAAMNRAVDHKLGVMKVALGTPAGLPE